MEEVLQDHATDRALTHHGYCVDDGLFRGEPPLRHWHEGVELVIPLRGVAAVHYNDSTAQIPPGMVVLGACDLAHGAAGTFYRTVIHFDPDVLPVEGRAWLRDRLAPEDALQFRLSHDAVQRVMWVAQQLRDGSGQNATPIVRGLLNMVVCELQAAEDDYEDDKGGVLLHRIIHYMEEHTDRSENVDVLAERFEVSRSALTELFRQRIGTPPAEYWLRLRLDRSRDLLSRGFTVQQVASKVGFDSRVGFSRAFKRYFGVPPAEYRHIVSSR